MANSVRPHFTITLDLKLVRGHHVDLTLKNVLFLILEIYIYIYFFFFLRKLKYIYIYILIIII